MFTCSLDLWWLFWASCGLYPWFSRNQYYSLTTTYSNTHYFICHILFPSYYIARIYGRSSFFLGRYESSISSTEIEKERELYDTWHMWCCCCVEDSLCFLLVVGNVCRKKRRTGISTWIQKSLVEPPGTASPSLRKAVCLLLYKPWWYTEGWGCDDRGCSHGSWTSHSITRFAESI